jgi:two-component sensor histidine kinase
MPAQSPTAPPQALAALREIARALSAAWDLDTSLDLIVRKTTELMQVDSCAIYLLDPTGDVLRLRASTGLARGALGRAALGVGEGMTGYAVQANRPVHAARAQEHPRFKLIEEAEETGFRSLLAVPLLIETRPIGAMNVQTRAEHSFTAGEVETLSLVAELAAGALAKAQLHDSQKRQIEELRALARLSEAVTAPQYLDDLLDVVTDMAARAMNADLCAIYLLDDEKPSSLALRSTAGEIPDVDLQAGDAALARMLKQVLKRGAAAATSLPTPARLSYLAVPLSVRDRAIGVFCCLVGHDRGFAQEQRALFQTLANQTALAIENVRLVTNAAVVREMHHRIKNNLQTVAMLMQLQLSEAERLEPRHILETNINRIHSIAAVHEALSDRGFRLVEVRDVLQRVTRATVSAMTHGSQAVELRLSGDTLQLPSRAATSLALVVNELVQNALEHGLAQLAPGEIQISLGRSPDEIVVVVRDNGQGMPADMQLGLGLEIAQTLVREELGGYIDWRDLGPGTEVVVRLPRALERVGGNRAFGEDG